MSRVIACPDRDVLERVMLGQLTGAEGEQFAAHLEQCDRCAAVVRTLDAEDTLVEAARAPSTVANGHEAEAVRGLVDRLSQLGPPAATKGQAASLTYGADERFDFLAPPLEPGELGRLGPYRVLKVLGSGGMGVVFHAQDVQLKREVALKVMKPEAAWKPAARERFLREAQAAAALEHENIVTIYQVGEERGVPFLAMQWLKGMSLEERLKQQAGPLTVPEVLQLGQQIARGLAVAHEHGVIHRDIKPANIFLVSGRVVSGRVGDATDHSPLTTHHSPSVKILDFGLARAVADEAHLTHVGSLIGTPSYMAPEQAQGEHVDERCDLFSLGVVLYRMCTGKLPFRDESAVAALSSLATDQPRPMRDLNPTVPSALADLVMQLLIKYPAGRPASGHEVADRLDAIDRTLAEPPNTSGQSRTEFIPFCGITDPAQRQRNKLRSTIAAALLIALVPLVYFFGGVVIRIVTNKGEVVVQVDDPSVEITVIQNGVEVKDRTTQREFVLTAGEGEIEIYESASGLKLATRKFTLTRGGKEYVVVTQSELAKAKEPSGRAGIGSGTHESASADADKRAAQWVLSIGGSVRVRTPGQEQEIRSAKDLPAGTIQLVRVDLEGKQQVSDSDLVNLKDVTNLTELLLGGTQVSDAGLAQLKTLRNLGRLVLNYTAVSDAGLEHLKALTELRHLTLNNTAVSGPGLSALTSLTSLNLNDTQVSDAGLEHLKMLTNLTSLGLRGTLVGDAGLEHLKTLTNLMNLGLEDTRVSDAGLVHLKPLTRLNGLRLDQTQVTGAGLAHLATLTELATLDLNESQVNDAGLEHVKALKNLRQLYLSGTRVSDSGLVHLRLLTNLEDLGLDRTQVGDAGLEHLKKLANGGPFGLRLGRTQVSDAGIEHLKALTNLTYLRLDGTRVSDAGIDHLKTLSNLVQLYLNGTTVTADGVAALEKALPNCKVHFGNEAKN